MEKVRHKIYGEGIIRKTRYNGLELYIEFEDGIDRWVFYDELEKDTKKKPAKKISKEPKIRTGLFGSFNDRWKIETLRMGIFSGENIEEFTFGRNREKLKLLKWLKDPKNGAIIIQGEYGVGKTHFLEFFKHIAIEDGWAVSFLQFDSEQNPLNRPKALYQEIIKGFRYKNGDFTKFLKELPSRAVFPKDQKILRDHPFFSEIMNHLGTNTEFTAIDWIKGNHPYARLSKNCPPIYKYSTAANIFCYLLGGIGYLAKNILGLKGFLIIFDEAEYIDPYWYNSYQKERGWRFLRGLIMMANNSETLLKEKIKGRKIEGKVSKEYWGENTELQYNSHYTCRYLWKTPSAVKLVFAFTPDDNLFSMDPLNTIDRIPLSNLNNTVRQKIAIEIATIYKKAYNFSTKRSIPLKYVEHLDSTRLYIKGIIEILDLIRFNPNCEFSEILA